MFEKILEKIILNYFGNYIKEINKIDLSLAITNGDI